MPILPVVEAYPILAISAGGKGTRVKEGTKGIIQRNIGRVKRRPRSSIGQSNCLLSSRLCVRVAPGTHGGRSSMVRALPCGGSNGSSNLLGYPRNAEL